MFVSFRLSILFSLVTVIISYHDQIVLSVADFCTSSEGYESSFCYDYIKLRKARDSNSTNVPKPTNQTIIDDETDISDDEAGDILVKNSNDNSTTILREKPDEEVVDEEIQQLTAQQIRDELRKIIQEETAKKQFEKLEDDPACKKLRPEYDSVCFATPPLAAFQETREFCLAFVKNCQKSLLTNLFTSLKNFKVDFTAYCKKHKERFRYVCPNPLRFQSFAQDAVEFCVRYKDRCPRESVPAEPVMFKRKDADHIYTREIEYWCTRTKRTAYNYCTEPDLLKVYKYQMFCGLYKYACIDIYRRVIYG